MKENIIRITLFAIFTALLVSALGCDGAVRGGANIILEDVSVGSLSTEGKPVTGLPSQKVNLRLKVATNEVRIRTEGTKTIVTLNPSGATIIISPDNTMFDGVKPEQVEIQWQTTESTK
jgi:hypothetical protein